MEPLFHQGDLVIADGQTNYGTGDIVVYEHPNIGRVIHRIIGRDGGRFVLKGDNNDWVDSYQPVRQDIIGKYRFLIPKAGFVFLKMRQPWIFTLISGITVLFFGVAMVNSPHEPKRKKGIKDGILYKFGVKLSQWKDNYWFPVYFIGFVCLVLGVFSFIKPIQETITNEILYSQQGQFNYSAKAAQEIYDDNAVKSGDPIFTTLTCKTNFTFDYQITSSGALAGGGDIQLSIILSSATGWHHTETQTKLTQFTGTTVHDEKTVDLCEIQKYLAYVGETTGVEGQQYILEVAPVIHFNGTVDGKLIKEQFAPLLLFQIDDQQIYLTSTNSEDTGDPLLPVKDDTVSADQIVPKTMNILGIKLPVRTGRIISIAGIIVCAVALMFPYLSLRHAEKTGSKLKDRLLFGHMLVEIQQAPVENQGQLIEVSSLDDLLMLAEKFGTIVMALQIAGGTDYFVQSEQRFFRHRQINPQTNED